jgi:hypothetical protein
MRKIVKITESELVKLINEVVLTMQQINDQEKPFEPFIYKVYSENETESFENTFKQPFPKYEILHFPMVVIGFETRVPMPLGKDKDPMKDSYEIEDAKVYVPFMYKRVIGSDKDLHFFRTQRASWVSCGQVRFTKNNIPKNMLEPMVRYMSGQTIKELAKLLGANPTKIETKGNLNSPSIIEKKLTDLLTPHTPKLPDLPPKKEYGDFEYAD